MRLPQGRLVFAFALIAAGPAAQQVDPNVRFDVVAIKAVDQANRGTLYQVTPARFESRLPIGLLVRQALEKSDFQIVGAPGWMDTERYAITATTPEGSPPAATPVMILNLLKDRFQLATHLETREQPVFYLARNRAGGRLGPHLTPTPADCQAAIAQRAASGRSSAGPPLPTPGPKDALPCGAGRFVQGVASASGRTIPQIIQAFSDIVGRQVIDRTGLTGMYDFALTYSQESARSLGRGVPGASSPPVDPDAASFAVALQEQLGLKLEAARSPVEIVVIDKLERPTLD